MKASMSCAVASLAAACVFAAGVALAQSPAVNPTEANDAAQQAARQRVQPLNNQPVWSEVRSGAPQTTTVTGRETNVLIQPQGETWRAVRNGPISLYSGLLLALMVLAVGAFQFTIGTMPLREPETGRKLLRFTVWERSVHWTTAISFVILAVSGLIMFFGKSVLLPLIGPTLFSWLAVLCKNLHNFIGPLFIVCIVLEFFTFVRNNFPRAVDFLWLRKFGGLFSREHIPSGRFNMGEKLWFWGGLTLLGIVVGASGLVLDFPNFNQTRQTMQIANVIHSIGALLFIIGALGHIYMGTLGVAGAYDAMRTGYVDETWAKEHHEYWYNEVKRAGTDRGATPVTGSGAGRPKTA
jgi:formate dehydrogenase subunit gamma